MNGDYQAWLSRREESMAFDGIDPSNLPAALFPYQSQLVTWALARGRAALFADTGLGKTAMQVAWAREVAEQRGRVLILAPLAVAEQTSREAAKFGVEAHYRRADHGDAITIANYEMLDRFDARDFAGVVLDESSIIKSFDGKMRTAIIETFQATPFRLACTATPAPNDHMELGNHSEFLGIKTRVEMLAEYFCHDGGSTQSWRLKGHARDAFWMWVCSWAALMRKPSDLGYSDDGFDLPPLTHRIHVVDLPVDAAWERGDLFHAPALGLAEQRSSRRGTMDLRVAIIADVVSRHDDPAIVWCEYNDESAALARAIPDAVEIVGAESPEAKRDKMLAFSDGQIRVLVTKPKIAGFGMNWQHCADVHFIGPSHSYEQTYQAIRRCWRFGQTRPVTVHTCVADTERLIVDNYRRKAEDAERMAAAMVEHIQRAGYQAGLTAGREWNPYVPQTRMEVPPWLTA